jgi:large subunit ribosomal protein L6
MAWSVDRLRSAVEVFTVSRIGKMPVPIPAGVHVEITDSQRAGAEDEGMKVVVTGPQGSLEQTFHPDMQIAVGQGPDGANQVVVNRPSDQRHHKALHGLTRALINNMVIGVDRGFTKVLDIVGVGYRASLSGDNLVLQLGHSHAIEVVPPPGIKFEVEARARGDRQVAGTITVWGIDKQVVGQVAAEIRAWRPPEPYKGKGIRYRGEYVRRKAGKAGKIG